ncbi:MAG: carboxypeptidase regulatory-like domain-containing protein, partial [Bacteroidota bacterium]
MLIHMQQRFLWLVLFTFSFGLTSAQKFSVKGQVTDSTGVTLPSATIMLLNPADSSLVNFGVSDLKGNFEIKNVNKGRYNLRISFVGYATFNRLFSTPETGTVFNIGVLKLEPESQLLQNVTVVGDKAPVTVKRDTIEFNAGSFKTKANANVEDLLKKLPGVEVESDGTVRAQGEEVQRVMVDGREFFGRDPKLATRNLPADAVEKVQIYDKKSDQALFTGIDDGSKEKTVNLELKEEKRNAAFGSLLAGIGSDNRAQAKANVNRFSKGKQLSFLGMGNNINEQGFSIGDYMNFSGGSGGGMGGGGGQVRVEVGGNNSNSVPLNFGGRQNGIMTNYAGGLNFNNDYNGGTSKAGGSYFYNRLEQNVISSLNRVNYLPEDPANNLPARSYDFKQDSRQFTTGDNHRGSLTVDHQLDSANSLKLTATASLATNTQQVNSQSKTFNVDKTLRNQSNRETYNRGETSSINSNLLWRHKFSKKGRTLSTNLTLNASRNSSDGTQYSTNDFFGPVNTEKIIDQTNEQQSSNQTGGV